MDLLASLAFELHEQWRKTKMNIDGSFQPEWQVVSDADFESKLDIENLPKYIRINENKRFEIDMANACFNQLSRNLQQDSILAAKTLARALSFKTSLSPQQIGRVIHKSWLNRNEWAKYGELDVDFLRLPPETQNAYMAQYEMAMKISDAHLLKKNHSLRLDGVIEMLTKAKSQGINVCYDFNGTMLYSEFDTPDKCYIKIFKMTKQEREIALEKADHERKLKMAQEEKWATNKIPQWQKRGEAIIYPARYQSWQEWVKDRASDLYHGADLESALGVMEALEMGKSIDESLQVAQKTNNSGHSWQTMMKIVTLFSKRGPEFYRKNNQGNIDEQTEAFLQKLEKENNELEKTNTHRKKPSIFE